MPNGPMGRTTLMGLSRDDLKSVERWHKNEWDDFREEVVAYKHKVLEEKRYRKFSSKFHQRGSIIIGAGNVKHSSNEGTDCTYTTSTIPSLFDFCIPACVARCRARLAGDGDWYWSEGTISWLTAKGTWQGNCAVGDYDTRWTKVSGDIPNEAVAGTDGVWTGGATTKAVGYAENIGSLNGSFTLECRDGTSLNTLFTDSFGMSAEATL